MRTYLNVDKRVALVTGIACCLTGCATSTGMQPEFYPQCYQPIQQIRNDRDYSQEAKQASVGAAVGALSGALVGFLVSRDGKGAAIGAVAGGVVGGTAGFIKARLEKIEDQNQRLNELRLMLGEEANNLDLDKASVLKSMRCYSHEMDAIKKAMKNGTMSAEEAQVRLVEIKSGVAEAHEFWEEHAKLIQERVDGFGDYIQQETANAGSSASVASSLSNSRKKQARLKTNLATAKTEVDSSYQDTMNKLDMLLKA